MPTQKQFKGKAIYSPSGKAGEYASWACNFYVGCSNGCTYCYLKKGRCKAIMGGDVPTLKKCFKNEEHALQVFEKELKANLTELRKHGLFFSFTTDPFLEKTLILTIEAINICVSNGIPVKTLTKTDIYSKTLKTKYRLFPFFVKEIFKPLIAFGFTLTGHDELEPGASTNAERIRAMKKLHDAGFKTFASIEPVIDFDSAHIMIEKSKPYCDLFKIGLMSGVKYNKIATSWFVDSLCILHKDNKIYFKDSLLKQAGIERSTLPDNCVNRNYNMFE